MARKRRKPSSLNLIAHQVLEPTTVAQAPATLRVQAVRSQQSVSLTIETTHPESPYVIRFETEQEVHAPEPAIATTQDQALHELFVGNLELAEQVSADRPRAPRPVVRRVRARLVPVLDFHAESATKQLMSFEDIAESTVVTPLVEEDPEYDAPQFSELLKEAGITNEAQESVPAATGMRLRLPQISFNMAAVRTMAVFMGLALAVAAPIHAISLFNRVSAAEGSIVSHGTNALAAAQAAAGAATTKDYTLARNQFEEASRDFSQAQRDLQSANAELLGIANVLPQTGRELKQARHLLSAGESLTRAAAILSEGMDALANRTTKEPTAAVALFDVYVEDALPELATASEYLSNIDRSYLPVEYRAQVAEIGNVVNALATSMTAFHESTGAVRALLGEQKRQRYLILFQNNTELRPTGGFWGSLAEIDVLDGELARMEIPGGGSYFGQGQLANATQAPQPLQLLKGRWELQDANWFPDFPSSARKGMELYEASGGPSVDGVIAINASLVAKLIDATGEIPLPEYGMVIDGENFLFQVQKQVELDYDKSENKPKAIIGDMAPILIERMTGAEGENFLTVAQILSRGLSDRDIQIYHTNPDVQSSLSDLGWTGEILGNTGDYVHVSHTNIGGGKTDGVISDNISIESTLRPDGRIENVVRIERTHHGLATSLFSGSNNVSFTRLYVPRGSTLLSVTGAEPPDASLFESTEGIEEDPELARLEPSETDPNTGALIAEGFGKTSFGHWMQTRPGTTSVLTFRYVLPADILAEEPQDLLTQVKSFVGIPETVRHSILIQKQPGVERRQTHYTFVSNNPLTPVWTTENTSLEWDNEQNTDGYFGMILER